VFTEKEQQLYLECRFHLNYQRPWKIIVEKYMLKVRFAYITMTVISLREELIDWYKTLCGYGSKRNLSGEIFIFQS
jgi:hypothetical protein